MCIYIYDIDGTLTHIYGDITDITGFDTYAFWPLISYNFTIDKQALRIAIAKWEESMKTEQDPTGSSYNMMQKSINTFVTTACAQTVREYAKNLTLIFAKCGVLREEAISHLAIILDQGNTCVLSTGSYQDGAYGFIDGLVAANLLSPEKAKKILVSGAIIDWKTRKLLHANVREKKLVGLEKTLGESLSMLKPKILAVFADDPLINDRDILMQAPGGGAYVIPTNKNRSVKIPDSYNYFSWNEILKNNYNLKARL